MGWMKFYGAKTERFYCPQPALNMLISQRKGETQKQYGKRFMLMQDKYGKMLELSIKIERAAKFLEGI